MKHAEQNSEISGSPSELARNYLPNTERFIRSYEASQRSLTVEVSDKLANDFTEPSDPMRYTNHSCAPNARLCIRQGRVEFYALRTIAVDEEITVNYGETHHEGKLVCQCGAVGCVGRI